MSAGDSPHSSADGYNSAGDWASTGGGCHSDISAGDWASTGGGGHHSASDGENRFFSNPCSDAGSDKFLTPPGSPGIGGEQGSFDRPSSQGIGKPMPSKELDIQHIGFIPAQADHHRLRSLLSSRECMRSSHLYISLMTASVVVIILTFVVITPSDRSGHHPIRQIFPDNRETHDHVRVLPYILAAFIVLDIALVSSGLCVFGWSNPAAPCAATVPRRCSWECAVMLLVRLLQIVEIISCIIWPTIVGINPATVHLWSTLGLIDAIGGVVLTSCLAMQYWRRNAQGYGDAGVAA